MLTPEEYASFLASAGNVQSQAERHLNSHRSQQSVIAFVSNLQAGVSRVLQAGIERGVNVACKAGCSHCCHARVEAMAAEVFLIARHLKERPPEEQNRLIAQLRAHVAANRVATKWSQRTACPFLARDLCGIYEVRPSVCRKAHSLDSGKCREYAEEIPQDLGIAVSAEALAMGTSNAYQKLGFNSASYELGSAVLMALIDSSAESRWFSGEPFPLLMGEV
jgi:Fe-S-cluster containining protein